MVQGLVNDGWELWYVEGTGTGRRFGMDEREYRMLFDGAPPRGLPRLSSASPEAPAANRPAKPVAWAAFMPMPRVSKLPRFLHSSASKRNYVLIGRRVRSSVTLVARVTTKFVTPA